MAVPEQNEPDSPARHTTGDDPDHTVRSDYADLQVPDSYTQRALQPRGVTPATDYTDIRPGGKQMDEVERGLAVDTEYEYTYLRRQYDRLISQGVPPELLVKPIDPTAADE